MPTSFAVLPSRRLAALSLVPLAALCLVCAPVRAQAESVGAPADAEVVKSSKEAHKAAAEKARHHQQLQREAERKEIVAKRELIEQQRAEQEKLCYQKFAVEGCLADARKQAREKDEPLRMRELQINDSERREKAAERLQSIEEKKAENAAVPMKSQQRDGSKQPSALPAPKGVGAKPDVDEKAVQAQRQSEAQLRAAKQEDYVRRHEKNRAQAEQGRAEREAKARADHEAKLKEAADHKASRLKQAQERGKTAAPLPAPAP